MRKYAGRVRRVERQFGRSHDPCQIPSLAQTIHAVAHSCPVAQCPATVAPRVLASGKSGGGVFLFSDDRGSERVC